MRDGRHEMGTQRSTAGATLTCTEKEPEWFGAERAGEQAERRDRQTSESAYPQ